MAKKKKAAKKSMGKKKMKKLRGGVTGGEGNDTLTSATLRPGFMKIQ